MVLLEIGQELVKIKSISQKLIELIKIIKIYKKIILN